MHAPAGRGTFRRAGHVSATRPAYYNQIIRRTENHGVHDRMASRHLGRGPGGSPNPDRSPIRSLPTHGWHLRADALRLIAQIVAEARPRLVLEFGSGSS